MRKPTLHIEGPDGKELVTTEPLHIIGRFAELLQEQQLKESSEFVVLCWTTLPEIGDETSHPHTHEGIDRALEVMTHIALEATQ